MVAAILFAYRSRLKQRAEIIKNAPEADRLEAIAATAEFFRVDVSGLSRAQKQDIVLTQIRLRARREMLLAGIAMVISILLAAIAITSLNVEPKSAQTLPQDQIRLRLNLDQVKAEPSWMGIPAGVWTADGKQWLSVLKAIDTTDDPTLKQKTDDLISIISNAAKPNVVGSNFGENYVSIPKEAIDKFRELRAYIRKKAITAGITPSW